MRFRLIALALGIASGCSFDPPGASREDAHGSVHHDAASGPEEAGSGADSGPGDSGSADATDPRDAGPGDRELDAGEASDGGIDGGVEDDGGLLDGGVEDTGVADGGSDGGELFAHPPSNFDPSRLTAPTRNVRLNCGDSTFDSTLRIATNWCGGGLLGSTVVTQADGTEAVLIPLRSLRIERGARLLLRGNRPVILGVWGDVLVEGAIEASASGRTRGPGGEDGAGCGASGRRVDDSGGGGGGGGFGAAGARGGDSASGAPAGGEGPIGGTQASTPLRGGCAGGDGGGSVFVPGGASGGAGGGGVQISAAGRLTLVGRISASGGGGRGAARRGGGGGGGSGGGVLLEAAELVLDDALLVALGGGGGEGGPNSGLGSGEDGQDGPRETTQPAAGGRGGANGGGDGGDGAGLSAGPGEGSPGTEGQAGGGGGGGGPGRIHLNGASCEIRGASRIAPAPTGSGAPGCPGA